MSQLTYGAARENAALWVIVEGVEWETGDRFFYSLVRPPRASARAPVRFRYRIVKRAAGLPYARSKEPRRYIENFQVPLMGMPCESVLHGQISHITRKKFL